MREPFAIRVLAWSVVAAFVGLLFVCLGLGLDRKIIDGWFEGKLAFLGLSIAGGTFQYGTWTSGARGVVACILDPALRETRPKAVAGMLEQQLPHNRAVLANYAIVSLCLLASAALDFGGALVSRDLPAFRSLSTGLFAVTLLPFVEILARYVWALAVEFRAYVAWFEAAR